MRLKSFVRTVSAALWSFLLIFYVAAKLHFFLDSTRLHWETMF